VFVKFLCKMVGRSSRWPGVRADHLRANPHCAACGAERGLQVHHKLPIHVAPHRELDVDNLITLCLRCHLFVGHLGDWNSWNPAVVADALCWQAKVTGRPYLRTGVPWRPAKGWFSRVVRSLLTRLTS